MTLSVCIIVKDEQSTLARCLDCVKKFADEIVIADTGSTDDTVEIAKRYTDKVYYFEWICDFSAARNFVFDKATCDYVMWLDADDVITDENCTRIRNLVDNGGFDMAFLIYAAGLAQDKPAIRYYRERIFLRSRGYRFSGAVHEAVVPFGNIVYSEAEIEHRKVKQGDVFRNLGIYQKLIAAGKPLDERSKFYYGRELMFNGMYREAAAVLENFLSGDGWVENKIEACLNLRICYGRLGNESAAFNSLLRSFSYDKPRAEACCIMGEYFSGKGNLSAAIYWYTRALTCKDDLKSGAFVNADYSEFIPCMQLCVLYDKLKRYKTACAYNERAGRVKPQSAEYLYNRRYFENKLHER